ncbi:conserved hypothetical protein [delta proteobacterium NaphS2]|nr:conserved hypothetical protein [delta proteobacterium NaphS2]
MNRIFTKKSGYNSTVFPPMGILLFGHFVFVPPVNHNPQI